MRFRVPQFIDIEDKIFGPFTFKQFVYLIGGAGISFVAFKVLPNFIAILIIIPVVSLSLALTFYKINNKPFIYILEAYVKYLFQGKLYIWKKSKKKKAATQPTPEEKEISEKAYIPRLSEGRLKDISWSLDVLDMKEKEQ
ncbi:hypothetical protein COB64_02045 [Candidatus Wolfebacteria bacterium]|nr:MAG: hypothetical protein COB64_02045 [Candidatus Wolfebacteria bacterium]